MLQATSVWVAVDVRTGSPVRLGDRFHQVYGPSAGARRASARLALGGPADAARRAARPWPVRASDLDVWGHVNNAVAWAAVEDAGDPGRWSPVLAELEHPRAIERGCRPQLAVDEGATSIGAWLLDEDGSVLAAARVQLLEGGPEGGPAGEDPGRPTSP